MLLRLATSAERFVLLAASLLVAAFLVFCGVRAAWATHRAESGTEAGITLATRLEPDDPDNFFQLGRFWQFNLENADPDKAIRAYRQAAAIDPYSADTYINLATAYETQNDIPNARENFLKAQHAYPASSEVAWRVGNFFLRQDDLPTAFRDIRASVEADPGRGAEAFSRCLRVAPDLQTVLEQAIPPLPGVYLDILHDLSGESRTTEALIVWDRLLAMRPSPVFSPREIAPLVNALRAKKQIAEAARVWRQAVQLGGLGPGTIGDPLDSVLWDGGFESGFNNVGYSWSYSSNPHGVQIQRDSTEKHSGQSSLRLTFDGTSDVSFADVCHSVPVSPLVPYQFSAWVRTRELTSDQGIRFRIQSSTPVAVAAITPETHGTTDWTRIDFPWTSDSGAFEAQLCIVRLPSDQSGSRIRGTAWIDDVSLTPRSFTSTPIGTRHP